MGACIVSGYNNWGRIAAARTVWAAESNSDYSETAWAAVFATLVTQRERYQDRFILMSEGPYSGVAADRVGLRAHEWRTASMTIRLEHECAHYVTKRLFGLMQHNLLDELVADYAGVTAAIGVFKPAWFQQFMGIEDENAYRSGGRLENYRGPALSDAAFALVRCMVRRASEHLGHFDRTVRIPADLPGPLVLAAIFDTGLERLAAADGADVLARCVGEHHHGATPPLLAAK